MVSKRKNKRPRQVVRFTTRTPAPPSVWSRLKVGIAPPLGYQTYYRCILTFLFLYVYLIFGGIFLWIIHEQSPKPAHEFKARRKFPPKGFSHSWSLFDAGFMCYAIISGSGAYPELSVDTKRIKLYLMLYAILGCPIVILVVSYMITILTMWGHALSIFTTNATGILLDYVFDRSPLIKSQISVEEIYRSSPSWPVAFSFLVVYTVAGSCMFLYNKDTEVVDVIYSSFSAFVTVEVGQVFNVPSRNVVYLTYLLFGIAACQIYIECSRKKLDKFLFEEDDIR